MQQKIVELEECVGLLVRKSTGHRFLLHHRVDGEVFSDIAKKLDIAKLIEPIGIVDEDRIGRPIAEFQGLQWMLADMSIGLAASRALIHNAAAGAGDGFPDMREAAQAKILASETAIKVTTDALQIHGAVG